MPCSRPVWLVPRRVAVHVRVDPDEAERRPWSARATPVQVPPAQLWSPPSTQGRRPARIASATAEASRPQSLLTATCLRRSLRRGAQDRSRRRLGTPHAASAPTSSGISASGRLGAAGLGAAEAPGGADQFDVSLHRYTRFSQPTTLAAERQVTCWSELAGPIVTDSDDEITVKDAAAASGRTGRASRSGCGSPCRRGSADYADARAATGNAAFVGLALALAAHFGFSCDHLSCRMAEPRGRPVAARRAVRARLRQRSRSPRRTPSRSARFVAAARRLGAAARQARSGKLLA